MTSALTALLIAALPIAGQIPSASASRVRLELETPVSTRTARVGDPVPLRTASAVVVDGVLIPAGCPARGVVSRAVRAGRVRGQAELEVRIESIVAPDGRSVPVNAGFIAMPPPPRPRQRPPAPTPEILAGMGVGYATAGLVSKASSSGDTIVRSGVVAGLTTGVLLGVLKRGDDIVLYRGETVEAVVWPRRPVVR
jgi:hypothetical protein